MSSRKSKSLLPEVSVSLVRSWNRLLYLRYDPTRGIAAILIAILGFLILAPIISMIMEAFLVQFRDTARIGQSVGEFTLYYFERVFSSRVSNLLFWTPLVNTITISFLVVAIAVSLGILLAWLIVCTDMPSRRWFASTLIIPYILPSWTFALVWLSLFKNRRIAGVQGIAELFGFQPPDWLAYGMFPIVICLAFHYFPLVFLLFGAALRSLNSQLEETARILKASKLTIIRKIVMPLMRPALMSAILLTFSRAVGTFGTPYILGSPVRFDILSTSLYGSIRTGSPGVSSVLTGIMVILGISMVLIDSYIVREAHRFVTVGGKGEKRDPTPLGKYRIPAAVFVFLIFLFTTIIPIAVLIISTLTRVPGVFTLENFTTEFWVSESIKMNPGQSGLVRNAVVLKSLWNSLRIAGAAAIIAGLLGTFVGYIVAKFKTSPVAQYLRQVSFFPYLVPSIGFGAAYLTLFAVPRGPIPSLYGTLILVVIVMSIKYLPFASRAGISAMMQLGNEPEEAAMLVGAPWHKRLTRIVIPIQKGTLVIGILLPFISGMKELSLIVMLATPGTEFLTTQVLRFLDYNYEQLANGVTLIIVFIVIVLTYVFQRLTGSTLAKGLGG
jgi:iron(III) transport system permease protein